MTATTAAPPNAPLSVVDDPVEQGRWTRWVSGAAGERLGESSLQLSGMYCAACGGIIERAIAGVDGVRSVQVNASAQRATVCWDPQRAQPSALIEAVRGAGYDAVPDAAAPARALRRLEHRRALWRLFVASFCAMQVMMMATPSYVAGPGEMAPDLWQLLAWGSWLLTLPVLVFSAGPFFGGAWRALRQRRIAMEVPVALGIAITFVASTGATFDPGGIFGDEVYFDSLTMFVSFLLGARYLELLARHRAAQALEGALACLPETAWRVAADGSVTAVGLHRLRPGDLVRVPVGQAFPADGVLQGGSTQADESLLSGESQAVPKADGATLVAGSVNLGAPVLMRVQRVGQDTRFEAIVSMMRSAMSQRPASARLADRWAAPFLWVVLLLAAGGAAVWSVIDPSRALWVAVAVLIVTCPCALSLAAPAALTAAARGLARRGVMVQRLDAIEALATAQHFFFDKTGTLTEDRLQLHMVQLTDAGQGVFADAAMAQALAATLAAWSSHPLSRALADAVRPEAAPPVTVPPDTAPPEAVPPVTVPPVTVPPVTVPPVTVPPVTVPPAGAPPVTAPPAGAPPLAQAAWSGIEELAGHGLRALDECGREWRLGAASWVDADTAATGVAQVWLGCRGQALASFEFEEVLRPGTAAALQALRGEGVAVTVLTGDTPERARALAARIGVDDVRAGATPEAKLAAVAAAQAAGLRVAMVGDGINDAPVLARADVSLAMGQGALVSRSQADAVIASSQLGDLVRARRTAQRALRIVRQNFVWAGSYNALCIPLALVGWLPPWAAGLGMAASSLIVVFNALRAAR